MSALQQLFFGKLNEWKTAQSYLSPPFLSAGQSLICVIWAASAIVVFGLVPHSWSFAPAPATLLSTTQHHRKPPGPLAIVLQSFPQGCCLEPLMQWRVQNSRATPPSSEPPLGDKTPFFQPWTTGFCVSHVVNRREVHSSFRISLIMMVVLCGLTRPWPLFFYYPLCMRSWLLEASFIYFINTVIGIGIHWWSCARNINFTCWIIHTTWFWKKWIKFWSVHFSFMQNCPIE